MPISPPEFVRGDGVNAVAEFRAFITAVGQPAVHLLADLSQLQNFGSFRDIPAADGQLTRMRGLYRRIVENWVVFYTAEPLPLRITVLHASRFDPPPFATVEAEAGQRLRRLSK